ncbi:uncharacterized protein BT62DRAFT_1080020 [Guyanagaster necrorhizus]|uniref:Uncharacterized protein n=1 Tax=Guyanagaster necrorhizus TaxID=856835 RepID=A0A9P7VI47_9AGAR|nr:uncharacterized protein BT62DRAFT_1080020 [Guyanagaster necrorhizus MCA 3950]KAG7441481.1 hypothetical protein BT62DRAFT_1080020 [Guyanagaster necrorhizus MCA 3950]
MHLPPGPKGLPLMGNLWDIPTEYSWTTYARWAAIYGDVLCLDTPGNPMVVLNLHSSSASLYRFHHGTVVGMGGFLSLHEIFYLVEKSSPNVSRRLPALYCFGVLSCQLHKYPDEFCHHVRHHADSITMKTIYRYGVDPNGDQSVELVDRAMEGLRITVNVGTVGNPRCCAG